MKTYRIVAALCAGLITLGLLSLPSFGSGFQRAIDVFWVFVVDDATR